MDKHFKSKLKAKTRCFGVILSPWSMQIRRSLLFFTKSMFFKSETLTTSGNRNVKVQG